MKEVKDVKQDPYKLPDGFAWDLLDWEDAAVVEEAYVLLRDNYVEDDDAMFRFDYSRDFLRWALTEGESQAAALDYAPLPASMATRLTARLDSIKVGTTR